MFSRLAYKVFLFTSRFVSDKDLNYFAAYYKTLSKRRLMREWRTAGRGIGLSLSKNDVKERLGRALNAISEAV